MKYLLLLLTALTIQLAAWSQPLTVKGRQGGIVSFGQRTTASLFNDGKNEPMGLGFGGQFRVQASNRVNTEWFADYIPSSNGYERRNDYHIGWSVLFYVRQNPTPKVRPYVLAGHCFDYSRRQDLSNPSNFAERWSAAVQAGAGTHFWLTDRLDLSLSVQYMMHLGTHIETDLQPDGTVEFTKERGGSLEGHLLATVSLNYKIVDLWSGK